MILPDGLLSPPIAHRGLWSAGEAAENSLAAIARACQAAYGVEFDVRLSADGEAVVFHDETLKRLAGIDVAVADLSAAELAGQRLLGGPDTIPTLGQVLDVVDGRAMLLIELKPGPDPAALAARTAALLDAYRGAFAVIGFDAESLGWFARHRPDWPRGLDAMWETDYLAEARQELERLSAIADPHFLVLELEAARSPVADQRRRAGQPVVAWTVRSTEDAARVADHCDNFIFEGFTA